MSAKRWMEQAQHGTGVFVRDVGNGLLEMSHNTLAMLGLAVVAAVIFMGGTADMRERFEGLAFGWLKDRQEQKAEREGTVLATGAEAKAVDRVLAADPSKLNKEQAAVAAWLSKRYRVALEPVSRLVLEAWSLAPKARVEPTLIMAMVAIESSFNPFAESPMGAQGLMQVMTRVHDYKYRSFGGSLAALDPVANLRVGVQVLRDCVRKGGGVPGGLRCYVGAIHPDTDDNGYVFKVTAEHKALKQVAAGQSVPTNLVHTVPGQAPNTAAPTAAAKAPTGTKPAPAALEEKAGVTVATAR